MGTRHQKGKPPRKNQKGRSWCPNHPLFRGQLAQGTERGRIPHMLNILPIPFLGRRFFSSVPFKIFPLSPVHPASASELVPQARRVGVSPAHPPFREPPASAAKLFEELGGWRRVGAVRIFTHRSTGRG